MPVSRGKSYSEVLDAEQAEDLANDVQDGLMRLVEEYSGTSPQSVARGAYDEVLRVLGFGEDLDDEEGEGERE